MTNPTEAPGLTDAELRALWQASGGTFYSSNREVGSMPVARLLPFLRGRASSLPPPVNIVDKLSDRAMAELRDEIRAELAAERAEDDDMPASLLAPGDVPKPSGADQAYARALVRLVAAIDPELQSDNLLEDVEAAIAALEAAKQEAAGTDGDAAAPKGTRGGRGARKAGAEGGAA
jgi:hypothetical protein